MRYGENKKRHSNEWSETGNKEIKWKRISASLERGSPEKDKRKDTEIFGVVVGKMPE